MQSSIELGVAGSARSTLRFPTMRIDLSKCLFATAICVVLSTPAVAYYPLPPAETGDLYVSSYENDRVCVFGADGGYLGDFTGGGLQRPRGLVVSAIGEVYVASQDTDEILVFGPDQSFRRSFTGPGLDGPAGMAPGPDGVLYVCGANSNKVFVFNADDEIIGFVEGGGLSWPNGVAVDLAGDIYVTSVNTDDVRKYNSSGGFMYAIGGGGLDHPTGLALSPTGAVYVAGSGSNNVVKYGREGGVLGVIEHEEFASPQSIAFDDEGLIYISQFFSDAVVVFTPDEQYETSITGGSLDAPRAFAFLPGGSVDVPADQPTERLVSSVRLVRVIPQPFTASTEVFFELNADLPVTLFVYDTGGRLVRRLLSSTIPAGIHTARWDGSDGSGRAVPAGTFFYDLRVGDERRTGRLIRLP